jgi:hypothetical protein
MKTCKPTKSACDLLNTRRLLIYIDKLIIGSLDGLDDYTVDNIKSRINKIINYFKDKQLIETYSLELNTLKEKDNDEQIHVAININGDIDIKYVIS